MATAALILLLAQLACTLFMTGLIWFVQVVHYPLFAEVGAGVLARYEMLHAERTGWVVFLPMVVELGTSAAMLYPPLRPGFCSRWEAWVLAGLVGVIWATTGLGHVPLHTRLGRELPVGEARQLIGWLVGLNWIRTVGWTVRSGMLLGMVWRGLRG